MQTLLLSTCSRAGYGDPSRSSTARDSRGENVTTKTVNRFPSRTPGIQHYPSNNQSTTLSSSSSSSLAAIRGHNLRPLEFRKAGRTMNPECVRWRALIVSILKFTTSWKRYRADGVTGYIPNGTQKPRNPVGGNETHINDVRCAGSKTGIKQEPANNVP